MTLQELDAATLKQLEKLTKERISLLVTRSGLSRKQQLVRHQHLMSEWARLEKKLGFQVKPVEVVQETQRRAG